MVKRTLVILPAWVRPWPSTFDSDLGHKLGCRHTTLFQPSDLFLKNKRSPYPYPYPHPPPTGSGQGEGTLGDLMLTDRPDLKTLHLLRRLRLLFLASVVSDHSSGGSAWWRTPGWMRLTYGKLISPLPPAVWRGCSLQPPPQAFLSSEVIKFNIQGEWLLWMGMSPCLQ